MELKCFKYGCKGAYKNGHMKRHQRYKCKNCGYHYTKTTPRGRPEQDKILALVLFLSRLSMRATGKIVGVTTQSVMRWIPKMQDRFVTQKHDIATVTEVEMDEMHHFFKKNSTLLTTLHRGFLIKYSGAHSNMIKYGLNRAKRR